VFAGAPKYEINQYAEHQKIPKIYDIEAAHNSNNSDWISQLA
jgi:hypothetical protein